MVVPAGHWTPEMNYQITGLFHSHRGCKCSCQSGLCLASSPVGAHRGFASGFYASAGPRLHECPPPPLQPAHTRSVLGFSRRRPVVLIPATFLSPPVPPKASSLLSFQWASAASFAFSSAIVNAPMRPHSSRPLQYEDGVGGSQRGAPSSGTHTGDRRAGKRRHGKSPEASRNSGEWRRFAAVGRPTRRWREAAERRCASIRLRFVEQQRDAVWRKNTGLRDRFEG